MKLDLVHDIQTAYRKVVEAMSEPGVVADLSGEADRLEWDSDCYPGSLLLALMLLDTEVSFKVVSPNEASVSHLFHQLTYAKTVDVDQADFIFVLHDASADELRQALEQAKNGELINPHDSATIIIETESLSSGHTVRLTGPGIQTERLTQLNLHPDWVNIRAERNAEFPLGIDLIVVDAGYRLLSLPRTTSVRHEEVG